MLVLVFGEPCLIFQGPETGIYGQTFLQDYQLVASTMGINMKKILALITDYYRIIFMPNLVGGESGS